jgi:hypothetical protein
MYILCQKIKSILNQNYFLYYFLFVIFFTFVYFYIPFLFSSFLSLFFFLITKLFHFSLSFPHIFSKQYSKSLYVRHGGWKICQHNYGVRWKNKVALFKEKGYHIFLFFFFGCLFLPSKKGIESLASKERKIISDLLAYWVNKDHKNIECSWLFSKFLIWRYLANLFN